jgi:transposase-like protein
MKCPRCGSTQVRKNGHRSSQQNYLCKNCGRQFVESYSQRGYSDDVKQICLRMYYNGLGFREIERLTGISHNTIINWVRQAELSPNDSEVNEIKEDTKRDERRECFQSRPCYQRAVFV